MEKSRQEVFNAAYRGLRAQKWERSVSPSSLGCVYNGPGGRHCAAGWVFHVPPEFEERSVRNLPPHVIPAGACLALLTKLQAAHDVSYSPEDMRERLARVATEYGLEIPPDDGQDPVLSP